ncbi:LacI family DNA-binding transcriptional regulator [Cerasicoccus fimbriatus]|uniref:LacI family DNA-binding transcriptional regulator n=1 Tax=Cerasicoccus fimbriatus TaxID=3014554 RepID=UPI0022B38384|nr:LacI family DNA-binding transcriptional regulator [Cerasicoccus sp. TK19100]
MKRVTMTDIAREAGVSKNTVSLALRNDSQIPPRTRERIQRIADDMGYQRNPIVAHLMTQLRSGQNAGPKATLALINANKDKFAFQQHPTIPTYVAGCKRRAQHLGYTFDTFWLHDPELDGERLNRILHARGIRGIIIVGLMNTNRLPRAFAPTWDAYPCVVTGVRTREPALPFACTDHHIIALRAFEKALELGYQRPALVLDKTIDDLVEGRFTAGYQIGQSSLPQRKRLKPFYQVTAAKSDPSLFKQWLDREKPDVIFTLYNVVRLWLSNLNFRVPEDIGLIQLEWRKDRPEWSGMKQHNDHAGEAAVDMVISMIHSGEVGVPEYPKATLIGGSWTDGTTTRSLIQSIEAERQLAN